jgi:hypothetical protein
MAFYDRTRVTEAHRDRLRALLYGLDLVSPATAGLVVEAWAVTWSNSRFAKFEDIPVSREVASPLVGHVNEVTRLGEMLGTASGELYGERPPLELLVPALMLHDVDKPMLFEPAPGGMVASEVAGHVPHGVLGALLLAELGLPDIVVSTVATHATDAPFHGAHPIAKILNYADMFSIDTILARAGHVPFYRR